MIFIAFKSHFKNRDFSYFDDNFNSLFIFSEWIIISYIHISYGRQLNKQNFS